MSHAEQIEALKGLLERVRDATGADRRLDYELFRAFAEKDAANHWDPKVGHFYTASTDAALGLVKASGFIVCEVEANLSDRLKLPSEAHIRTWEADSCGAVGRGPTHHGRGATPALAVLSALLSAKLALLTQEESNGH